MAGTGKKEYRKNAIVCLMALLFCLFSFRASAEQPAEASWLVDDSIENQSRAEDVIDGMTLHEKICQLFFVAPEQFSKESRV